MELGGRLWAVNLVLGMGPPCWIVDHVELGRPLCLAGAALNCAGDTGTGL